MKQANTAKRILNAYIRLQAFKNVFWVKARIPKDVNHRYKYGMGSL
jgi:hypothetical protein